MHLPNAKARSDCPCTPDAGADGEMREFTDEYLPPIVKELGLCRWQDGRLLQAGSQILSCCPPVFFFHISGAVDPLHES